MSLTISAKAMDVRLHNIQQRYSARSAGARERLATGSRFQRAADDAAGLSISTRFSHRTGALYQARVNGQEALGFMTLKDAFIGEAVDMLHRMRVLAVRASTDTVNDDQRADMGTELDQIKATYTQNLTKTFNGKRLFTNSRSGVIQDVVFQVGIDDKDSNRVRLVPDSIEKLWLEKLTRINLSNQGKSQFSLAIIDDVMANLSVDRSVVGAVSNRVGEAIQSTNDSVVLGTAAESQIRDADFAQETSELTKAEIVASTSVALMSQVRGMREMALQLL